MFRRTLAITALALTSIVSPPAFTAEAPATGTPATAAKPLLGFSPAGAADQLAWEERFDAALSADDLRTWMHRLAARPHHVGSPWGKANAEYMADLFRSWGYEVAIEEFWVLFPTPKERRLELLEPTPFVAALAEEPLAEDSTSGQTADQLPTYNAYSIDGDVTAELVYVNYGVPEDYEELAKHGVSVEGKIALARYGRSWRGIKPKVAAEHGAVGCIIYSDPAEDGYAAGDPYPLGGWRPAQGAQRGSVADMPVHSGDPLTPFVGATREARRLPRAEAKTLTRIPVLPIAARDAQPLLEALGGPVAPPEWRGALPLTYHLGPGPARVRLALAFNWDLVPAYDVIARLPGAERPEQWIVRGNHHDAWVNGASDPVSGMVTVLAEAKAVGELVRQGFRPRRTLVYAGWDGEEQGLLGSTEWAEHHASELREKAVAYLNTDGYERGFFGGGGSHALETLVNEALRDVADPQKGVSLAERARAGLVFLGRPEQQKAAREGKPLRLEALGSGSDFTPFLQHLGIASLNLGFGGEGEYGQYHSIYDSIDHFERFIDPGYAYGLTQARLCGRVMLRLANADVLPFDPAPLAATLAEYVEELQKLADEMREKTEAETWRIEEGIYQAFFDPTRPFVVPQAKEPVPHLNFAPLQNALAQLQRSVERYGEARTEREKAGPPLAPAEQQQLDAILGKLERALTRDEGLPGRPWYRHHLYAPGFYTGYGVKTLPAVREAIELRRWEEVPAGVEVTSEVFRALAAEVDGAAAVWKGR
jgi:N-acetylated-alpha-linked acidic dipeptidase